MDSFQLIIFGFFGVVTYFIVTDENVAALFIINLSQQTHTLERNGGG